MPLPNTYKSDIEIPDSENYSEVEVLWDLYKHFKNLDLVKELSVEDQVITLAFNSLFTINYQVEFSISKETELKIDYEIKLIKLIQVCVALLIFIAFFSSFGITGYLWFSAIFICIFFGLNLVLADNMIQKVIKSSPFFSKIKLQNEGLVSEEQKKWIRDTSKCPACGEDINDYDLKCPECGIRLRDKVRISPFNVSNYKQKRFKYHFKKKKTKKNDT